MLFLESLVYFHPMHQTAKKRMKAIHESTQFAREGESDRPLGPSTCGQHSSISENTWAAWACSASETLMHARFIRGRWKYGRVIPPRLALPIVSPLNCLIELAGIPNYTPVSRYKTAVKDRGEQRGRSDFSRFAEDGGREVFPFFFFRTKCFVIVIHVSWFFEIARFRKISRGRVEYIFRD